MSTIPDLPDIAAERRNRRIRAAALAVITLFVLGGLLGFYGVHTGQVATTTASGMRVELDYPQRARPALAVAWTLRITRPGGFDAPIEVSTDTRYLAMFDENGRNPEPDSSTTDGEETTWTFEPPEGDTLVVWLDTRVEPGVQWKRSATTTVRSGADAASVSYTTWIFP